MRLPCAKGSVASIGSKPASLVGLNRASLTVQFVSSAAFQQRCSAERDLDQVSVCSDKCGTYIVIGLHRPYSLVIALQLLEQRGLCGRLRCQLVVEHLTIEEDRLRAGKPVDRSANTRPPRKQKLRCRPRPDQSDQRSAAGPDSPGSCFPSPKPECHQPGTVSFRLQRPGPDRPDAAQRRRRWPIQEIGGVPDRGDTPNDHRLAIPRLAPESPGLAGQAPASHRLTRPSRLPILFTNQVDPALRISMVQPANVPVGPGRQA